ncbi:MAG: YqaA family protein [Nevskiales bacterium]
MSNMWRRLYDWVLGLSTHPKATWWLGGLSVAEASFFPIPVDVMLAPMVMAQRHRALQLALLTTVCSVLGGLIGYAIGYFMLDAVTPLLKDLGYWEAYEQSQAWFLQWGFVAVLIAGFSPIPFKIFTIAAGASAMLLAPFVVAALISRGLRYLLVAYLVRWAGPAFEKHMLKYIDAIGWAMLFLIVLGATLYHFYG